VLVVKKLGCLVIYSGLCAYRVSGNLDYCEDIAGRSAVDFIGGKHDCGKVFSNDAKSIDSMFQRTAISGNDLLPLYRPAG